MPSEDDVAERIRATVATWVPRRGPDWPDILMRLAVAGPPVWAVYATASVALVVLVVGAYLVASALGIGALAPEPVPANLH
jgi:hypothetical protein